MLSLVLFAVAFTVILGALSIALLRTNEQRYLPRRNTYNPQFSFIGRLGMASYVGGVAGGAAALGNTVGRPDGTVVNHPLALGLGLGVLIFVVLRAYSYKISAFEGDIGACQAE